jgi:hypothetical protein
MIKVARGANQADALHICRRVATLVVLPSAGFPISGAVAAARAVCGLTGVIARLVGVTVPASNVTATSDSHLVIATPEIR